MFKVLAEGNVFETKESYSIVGSRSAVLPDGRIICTASRTSSSGVNDFTPVAAYSDDGINWGETRELWPELSDKRSVNVSVRTGEDGKIYLCGIDFDIDVPGESWWSDELAAMKENYMAVSVSVDGEHFPLPDRVVLPYYGACENPGGMLAERDGRYTIVYSPYPTIEARKETDTCHLVLLWSRDYGKTWNGKKIAGCDAPSEYAEAWITKLNNGIKLVAMWQTTSAEHSDQYVYSVDGGETFSEVRYFPFNGQSMAITPWKDDKVIIVYNQRKESPVGVWIATGTVDEDGFHMESNEPAWKAKTTTGNGSSGEFKQWTDFSFGEPQATVLLDGSILICLWYEQDGVHGIRYVKLCEE